MVISSSEEAGISPKRFGSVEIVDRCILALVNEAAAILQEGIAQRPSDIDLVYLTGFGFPAKRGGPLFHADAIGIRPILRRMRTFQFSSRNDPDFWKPHPLLEQLAEARKSFSRYGQAS